MEETYKSLRNLGFAEATKAYDSDKGKFTTYLWPIIDTQFKIYFCENWSWSAMELAENMDRHISINGATRDFRDKVLSLSGRAQAVVDDVLRFTDEYLVQKTESGYLYPRRLGIIKRVASLGYAWTTARGIVDEITQMLQEA